MCGKEKVVPSVSSELYADEEASFKSLCEQIMTDKEKNKLDQESDKKSGGRKKM